MDRIAAVVVTHNRIGLLKDLITALRKQTLKPNAIFVVNNASTDGTLEWLTNQHDITVINQGNTGSSGGQYSGFKAAYEAGYEWLWIMDDDVEPADDCLEILVKNITPDKVHTPLRRLLNGKPFLNDTISYNLTKPFKSFWNRIYSEQDLEDEYTKATGITFEGPMFHRSLIAKIGLPEKKFFIYGDDTEYFIRAEKAGFEIIVVRDAKLMRKLPPPGNQHIFDWKTYYLIRNTIAFDVLHGNLAVRIFRPPVYFILWMLRAGNFKNIRTVSKAFWDGYFYKSDN